MAELNEKAVVPASPRLYNPKAFPWLSLFFSFLLPSMLSSINQSQLSGDRKRKWAEIGLSVLAFIVLAVVEVWIYDKDRLAGGIALIVFEIMNLVVGLVLSRKQKSAFSQWLAKGNKPRASLVPILIALLAVGLSLFAIVSVLMAIY